MGGKTQLLDQLLPFFPESFDTYYEPFIGGGAVFFTLAAQGRFKNAVLNDWNPELVNVYQAIKEFPEALIGALEGLRYDKEVFLEVRAMDPNTMSRIDRAARTIYLNKTCFNGLYRMNKKGQFNVPFGKFAKPPKILDAENIRACCEVLKNVTLKSGDFSYAIKTAKEGDLVYLDPPYVPLTVTSNFCSYTSDGFSIDDQVRLKECCIDLADRGVKVIASNSSAPLVRELYEPRFDIHEVSARRNINSKANGRGAITELVMVS